MKTLRIFLLLLFLPLFAAGLEESHVQGAWLQDGVRWTKAPADVNPHLQTGQAEILYFGIDHKFAAIYCTIYRVPGQYDAISHGDARGVYLGKWEIQGDEIAVEYRLVDRTVKLKGEQLPGPLQRGTIKASRGLLRLEKNSFRRESGLDKDAAEVVAGLPQSSQNFEGQKANIPGESQAPTLTIYSSMPTTP